jgi:hypothetical protein
VPLSPHLILFQFANALAHIDSVTTTTNTHEGVVPTWVIKTSHFPEAVPSFALVTPWCRNGNIQLYLRRHPSVNKISLVRSPPIDNRYIYLCSITRFNNWQLHWNISIRTTLFMATSIRFVSRPTSYITAMLIAYRPVKCSDQGQPIGLHYGCRNQRPRSSFGPQRRSPIIMAIQGSRRVVPLW